MRRENKFLRKQEMKPDTLYAVYFQPKHVVLVVLVVSRAVIKLKPVRLLNPSKDEIQFGENLNPEKPTRI